MSWQPRNSFALENSWYLPKHEGDFLRDGMALDLFPAFDFFAHDAFDCHGQLVGDAAAGVDHATAANANDAIGLVQVEKGFL